jgi:MFS family permease
MALEMWIFPSAAALVSALFALRLLRDWRSRRRAHLACWGLALAMFAVASGAAAIGMLTGWPPAAFRIYYLFGAILNVPFLALGTLHLLAPPRVARVATAVVLLLTLSATLAVAGAELNTTGLETAGIPSGAEVMPEGPRTLSRLYSFTGFLIVVAGALWSAWKLARAPEPALRRLAGANTLIALGTFVVAVASGFARYGQGAIFAVGLLAGVGLMFLGFLRTTFRPPT